jgi:tRNA threonylcarbamoyl adenosine modification protein YeaZ
VAWPTLGRVPDAALVLAVDTATPAVTAALVAVGPPGDPAGPPGDRAPPPVDQAPPPVEQAPPPVDQARPPVDQGSAPGWSAVDPASPPGDRARPPVDQASAPGWSAGLRLLAAQVTVDARRHGELLAPAIAATLAAAGRTAGELTAVVAGLGPGPYTGLRVGLVTAAALADAVGVPVYGVCSLDAVALSVVGRAPAAGRLLAATDARRREVYWASYDERGVRVAGPAVDRPAELAARLAGLGVTAMCGAGARQYAEALALPLLPAEHPAPLALAALARDRVLAGAPADPVVPLYLRRPDAVEPGRPKAVTPA